MKALIDIFVIAVYGVLIIAGVDYAQDKILKTVREMAFSKIHKGLPDMQAISHQLTGEKYYE